MSESKEFVRTRKRIAALGEDKVHKLNTMILDGVPIANIAKVVKEEWGGFGSVKITGVRTTLYHYRRELLAGRIKRAEIEAEAEAAHPLDAMDLVIDGEKTNCAQELRKLIAIQMGRIERAVVNEADTPFPVKSIDQTIDLTRSMILDLQKIQFDLGLDRFAGPVFGKKMLENYPINSENPDESRHELAAIADEANNLLNEFGVPKITVIDGAIKSVSRK